MLTQKTTWIDIKRNEVTEVNRAGGLSSLGVM